MARRRRKERTEATMDFVSESTAPVHPRVVEAVVKANDGFTMNFGGDPLTNEVNTRLCEVFERDLSAFIVHTGTAANAIALAAMVPPYGSILCHWDAHIETDECGAPEMFTFGARQVPLAGAHGRLDAKALDEYLSEARFGNVHALQPSAVSLANLSEAGTAYAASEIAEIGEIARRYGLLVHMDGARFANALVATGATAAEMTWKAGVDVLVLGTTKSGTFGAEVIISFRPELSKSLAFTRKRSGHFVPRSRFLAAQVEAYLRDGLWLENARHANAAACRLAIGLAKCPGVEVVHPTDGNEVFAAMPSEMTDGLVRAGVKFHRDWRLHPRQNRFVMSWAASFDEVDRMIGHCLEALAGPSVEAAQEPGR